MTIKVPRGKGYDKKSLNVIATALNTNDKLTLAMAAKEGGLDLTILGQAFSQAHPDWWRQYLTSRDISLTKCVYCTTEFLPKSKRASYCSNSCRSTHKKDLEYFGGNRQSTVGLAKKQCQMCLRIVPKGLSSHHVYGKANDPKNEHLVALCRGCHQLVSILAQRNFIDDPAVWTRLMLLARTQRAGRDVEPQFVIERRFG